MKKKLFLIVTMMFFLSSAAFYYKMNRNDANKEYLLGDTNTVGDVNGDGKVTVADYTLIRKHMMGNKLTGDRLTKADINSDGKVSIADYNSIRKIILGTYSNNKVIVTFVGKDVIETNHEGKVIIEGGNISERKSGKLKLSTNKDYRVSFDYVTSGNDNKFSVDFYPDTLPQINLVATKEKKYYEWNINTNKSDITKSILRFFDDNRNTNEKDIIITNVLLRSVDKESYPEGSTFTNLPEISKTNFAWYTDSSCKTKVTSSTKVVKNMTLYSCLEIKNKDPFIINSNYEYIVGNINVLDYGADPTGVKDSTKSFKSAILSATYCKNSGSCGTNNGGVVYVPKGKYKITDSLNIPSNVSLVGELKEGTTDGTVLLVDYGKGSTNSDYSFIRMNAKSMIKNIAFYYPNQKINNGVATKYPPTIIQAEAEGLTLENLNFVNSYIAMDFSSDHYNNSLQYINNIYGTPLYIGIINDTNLDTIKLDNIRFGPNYWVNSGFSNVPSKATILSVLNNSSVKPSGLILERVDWYFLNSIYLEGYYHGLLFRNSTKDSSYGSAEGEMYNVNVSNSTYPIYIKDSRHMAITNSTFKANNTALYIEKDANVDITINSSNLSSSNNSIYNANPKSLSITNSTINGKIVRTNNSKMSFVSDNLVNTGYEKYNANLNNKVPVKSNIDSRITTKPKSNKIVVIKAIENEDITSKLNNAINSLSGGGIVYIPAGKYKITGKITVKSGIEIQGSTTWATDNSDSKLLANNNAYFSLSANSGLNGFTILYDYPTNPSGVSNNNKRYVIEGNGNNIYIKNIGIINGWKGIYLNNSSNHYIYHIWGSFLNNGITINGGSNGIIRDCHFTTNVLSRTNYEEFKKSYKYTLENQISYEINNTNSEVIMNSFVWGTNNGLKINGGNNNTILGFGVDMGNTSVSVNGSVNAQLINLLLTTKGTNIFNDIVLNINPKTNPYIETNSSGYINIINPIMWGNNETYAINLKGNSDIHINGGIIDNSNSPVIKNGTSALSIFGLIFNTKNITDIENTSGSKSANFTCPISLDGRCDIKNTSGVNFGLNSNCIVY